VVTSPFTIVRRGLSFSVHGQRVSGSNYLLDGVDNNNTVLTGPVAPTSAEAIEEFRMTKSSFSAESGRATGFVAQLLTRSGSNRFHGSVFEFLGNDALDANTFENNSKQIAKGPLRQNQFGYSLGGPILKSRTFFWGGLELSRLRYGTPREYRLPTSSYIAGLPEGSEARRLLTDIPPISTTVPTSDSNIGIARIQTPNRIDNLFTTARLDHHFRNAGDHLMFRHTLASATEKLSDAARFTGYPTLQPTDHIRGQNTVVAWTHLFSSSRVNDLRLGWSRERISLPRPRSDVPVLEGGNPFLPGSFRQSGQSENNNVIQLSSTFSAQWGRSALRAGLEYRRNVANSRSLGLQASTLGGTPALTDGSYLFTNLASFETGRPSRFLMTVDRFSSGHLRPADLDRQYRSNEYAWFVQDEMKLGARLSLNLGLRYEYYGVPHDVDRSGDVNFYFGEGSTTDDKLANGALRRTSENLGELKDLLYRRDRFNLVPSVGVAWDPFGGQRTLLRAGYALALDRVFDTLRDMRTNSQQLVSCTVPACVPTFLVPAEQMLSLLNQDLGSYAPGTVVQLDENLRTPYAQNWYLGIQHSFAPGLLLEIGHAGSVGRKLISRDTTNRTISGRTLNSRIGRNTFISNAGNSNYLALELGVSRRTSPGLQYQVSYTYSHAIDNQSDSFEGVRTNEVADSFLLASFTRQFDARVDRGNASFDQRHNLVFNAIWDLPKFLLGRAWADALLGRWTVSVIGAYRTGFPVTVIGSAVSLTGVVTALDSFGLFANRVDFLGGPGDGRLSDPTPVLAGVQWLNRNAFSQPAPGQVGSLGRGATSGPGFWNYDFALLRSIPLTDSGMRLQFRTEFYNLFNHANLGPPVALFNHPDFGKAYYGRNRLFSRFGELPLENPSRRIQFGLRFEF
jgi:TonB-dependent receptor-like protein